MNALWVACYFAPEAVEPLLKRLSLEQAYDAMFPGGESFDGEESVFRILSRNVFLLHKLLAMICSGNGVPSKWSKAYLSVMSRGTAIIGFISLISHSLLDDNGFSPQQAAMLLTMKNQANQTLMDIAITNKANPKIMLMLLALACQCAPNTIVPFLNRLSPEQAAAAILATTGTKRWGGWNALMFACRYAPDAVEAMLNKLSPEQASDAIFHDTGDFSDDEDGALSIAEKYAKDAFVPLMRKLLEMFCCQNAVPSRWEKEFISTILHSYNVRISPQHWAMLLMRKMK